MTGLQPVASTIPMHNYNAVELTMDRRFTNNWLLLASYRFSRLRGNYEGFFREDNGQSDPGITSLYDFPTNDPNFTRSAAASSATAATSASSASSAKARCRSIGRISSRSPATTASPTGSGSGIGAATWARASR